MLPPQFDLRRLRFIGWILGAFLLSGASANCQTQIRTIPLAKESLQRPVLLYRPEGHVTNFVGEAILSQALEIEGQKFDVDMWVFRLADPQGKFAAFKVGHTPIPVWLGNELWVIQSGSHYTMEIAPALLVYPSNGNDPKMGSGSVRVDKRRLEFEEIEENSVLTRETGTFLLSHFIAENHLNDPGLANPVGSLPLQNIVVDRSQVAFDVVFLKNSPIRMIFNHQFELKKMERNGKELEFDRKVWKGIHEKWQQSITDSRKLNRAEK